MVQLQHSNLLNMWCFLPFRDNFQRKLRELSLPSTVSEEIVKDVMGSPGQHQCGLVHAADEDQLDGLLSRVSSRWNTFEEPYNSLPFFHTWFVTHCYDVNRVCSTNLCHDVNRACTAEH